MDPIIRTCSLSLATLALVLTPVVASARVDSVGSVEQYTLGRLADVAGADAKALQSYSAALVADPASVPIALRTYRQAVESGQKELALRAARMLDTQKALPADGRILLISESFAKADWRGAELQIDRLEESGTFAFLSPVLRAWMLFGSGRGDPLAALEVRSADGLSANFAQEHRGILLLAMKQPTEGIAAINALRSFGMAEARTVQLRLAGAARLMDIKNRAAALELLAGDDAILALAREEIAAGRPLLGAVSRPNTGVAMLLARLSSDLIRDNASPVAVTLSQLGQFADASYQPGKLVLARAFAANRKADAALAALDALGQGRLIAALSQELRFDLLLDAERYDTVLDLAKARAGKADATAYDVARLGEVLSRMKRHSDAAASYIRAIDMIAGPDKSRPVPWNLWLLLGREYDLGNDWTRARPALERAVALGPDEPSALNHLGYAMLVNGGSVSEATRLIEKASQLRPGDAAISDSLGWALFRGGQFDRAIQILEGAVATDATVAEISEHLGDAYWAAGRRIDARYAWRAALVQADEGEAKRLTSKIDFGPDVKR